jgi:hypothetical protein
VRAAPSCLLLGLSDMLPRSAMTNLAAVEESCVWGGSGFVGRRNPADSSRAEAVTRHAAEVVAGARPAHTGTRHTHTLAQRRRCSAPAT